MSPVPRHVEERFPEAVPRLSRAFERDATFRELCEDYETCFETIGRLQSNGAASDSMRDEYLVLLQQLEGELLKYLEDHGEI